MWPDGEAYLWARGPSYRPPAFCDGPAFTKTIHVTYIYPSTCRTQWLLLFSQLTGQPSNPRALPAPKPIPTPRPQPWQALVYLGTNRPASPGQGARMEITRRVVSCRFSVTEHVVKAHLG